MKVEPARGPAGASLLGDGALPYVVPFCAFLAFLAARRFSPFPLEWTQALQFGIVLILLVTLSRGVIPPRISNPVGSVLLGVAVFVIWIAPDVVWPGYRQVWLFHNGIVGAAESSLPHAASGNATLVLFRVLSSVLNVPVLEELFWRGWLLRWVISTDFRRVPLGSYSARSFWFVAILFSSEHGPYWDVGLAAGILYNWWMIRTRSLSDCMLAHAVTNACLAWYVLARDQWQYWL